MFLSCSTFDYRLNRLQFSPTDGKKTDSFKWSVSCWLWACRPKGQGGRCFCSHPILYEGNTLMFQRFHPGSSVVTRNISIIFSRHWNMQVTTALEVSKKVLSSLHHLSHFFQLSIIFYVFGPLTVFPPTLKCALVPLPGKNGLAAWIFPGEMPYCHTVFSNKANFQPLLTN